MSETEPSSDGIGHEAQHPDNPKEHVFRNAKNILISPRQVDNALAKLRAQNPGMKPSHCHDLRHSFAYNFLLKGGSMYSLQAVLGHKQISMTVDLYRNLKAADVGTVSPYGF